MAFTSSLVLDNGSILPDVRLAAANGSALPLPESASLRFLSLVETGKIPCYMTVGPSCKITTASHETERWFSQVFASGSSSGGWWDSARTDSPLGVLVAVDGDLTAGAKKGPRVTEVLLYASKVEDPAGRPPTPPPSSPSTRQSGHKGDRPTLSIHALALSSDLLHTAQAIEPTPPPSPTVTSEVVDAVFLPRSFTAEGEVINEPPTRKRRSAADAFDEANERRKKARRRGGEGVIAAAAPRNESQMPSLKHSRSVSLTQSVPLQTRPLSRSPSVASSRPPTAVALAATKKSSLSRVQSTVEPNSIEARNKDFISRIVMAGMRLHGLSQSKSRSSKRPAPDFAAPSPAVDASFDDMLETERKQDEEFKLVYHQVYKGTCFAFRAHLGTQLLQPFAEHVRETVDKLLAIFCTDPLAQGLASGEDKVTPGGRKAFGSVQAAIGEEKSPFLLAAGQGGPVGLSPGMAHDRGVAG